MPSETRTLFTDGATIIIRNRRGMVLLSPNNSLYKSRNAYFLEFLLYIQWPIAFLVARAYIVWVTDSIVLGP